MLQERWVKLAQLVRTLQAQPAIYPFLQPALTELLEGVHPAWGGAVDAGGSVAWRQAFAAAAAGSWLAEQVCGEALQHICNPLDAALHLVRQELNDCSADLVELVRLQQVPGHIVIFLPKDCLHCCLLPFNDLACFALVQFMIPQILFSC